MNAGTEYLAKEKHMKLKKVLALALAAALAVGTLAACGGSGGGSSDSGASSETGGAAPSGGGAAAAGDTLHVVINYDASLGTVADSYSSCWMPMRMAVSEALTKVASDGSIEPWLATGWQPNDDATEWVFTIRDDVYFSTGTKMTPTLVADAINYLYDFNDPANGGSDSLTPFMIRPTAITPDDAAGTVTFTFDTPVMNVPCALSNPAFGIINWYESDHDTIATYEVGTGHYVYDAVTEGHSVTLSANEHYYEDVPFQHVEVIAQGDSAAQSYALQDGSADVAFNLAMSDIQFLNGLGDGYETHVAAGARSGFFFINFDGVLGNEVLRKAVITAIDMQTIDEITVGGSYIYGWTILSPTYSQYGGDGMANPYQYDPAAANAMLDEAGIIDNDGDGIRELDGQNIDLNIVSSASRQMDVMADAFPNMLAEIGIGSHRTPTDNQVDVCTSGAFDLVNWNQVVMQTGDPSNFLYQWDSNSPSTDYGRYDNAEYNALYDQLIATADADEAASIVTQMQQILLDDGAYLLGGYYNFNSANTSAVTGVVTNGTADYYWITNDIAPAQ